MKKYLAIIMAAAMVLVLAACGNSGAKAEPEQEEQAATEEQQEPASGDGNILIIYFSAANRADVDSVSSATPMGDASGTTGWMAELIQGEVGGDIVKLTPASDYPKDYDATADQAKQEADSGARPDYLPLDANPADYDTIFIGYPIWWYEMPMVVEKFFDDYDLSGKTIVPFNAHEGSGDGGTYSTIKEREPGATILDGFALKGGSAGTDSAEQDIKEWISSLGLE